jgi:hypothetical protein
MNPANPATTAKLSLNFCGGCGSLMAVWWQTLAARHFRRQS